MSTENSSRIRIEDLEKATQILDSDLLIVEDKSDTKQATFALLKQMLNGDFVSPSNLKFYSSQKIEEEIDNLIRMISNKIDNSALSEIKDRINSIIGNSTTTDGNIELIDARNGYRTLAARLEADRTISDSKYFEKFAKTINGKYIHIPGQGEIEIEIVDTPSTIAQSQNMLYIHSLNILDFKAISVNGSLESLESDKGFSLTRNPLYNTQTIDIDLYTSQSPGKYFFCSEIETNVNFEDTITFIVEYSDGSILEIPFTHTPALRIEFEAKKSFQHVKIKYTGKRNFDDTVSYKRIMLTKNKTYQTYIDHYHKLETRTIGAKITFTNNNYVYEYPNSKGELSITYRNDDINAAYLYDAISEIQAILNNQGDKCGLLTDRGYIQDFSNTQIKTPIQSTFIKDELKSRNNVPSYKLTVNQDANQNIVIKQPISNLPTIESVSLSFYIDAHVAAYLGNTNAISFMLCCDDPDSDAVVNYYRYNITKDMLVQGWNTIKRSLTDFTTIGLPNPFTIRSIVIEVYRNSGLNNNSIWFNSVTFNQKMKPVVLLSFDGFYNEALNYTFPLLNSKNIPATIFLNSATTLTGDAMNQLIRQRISYGWDIGCYGCNPNKENLTEDDNYYLQYMSLVSAKQYLHDNLASNPISYSAPYGNLRSITVPILKDLGYGIAKVKADNYCSIFTRKDFAIPCITINNQTVAENIYHKIDYAISTGQALSLHTCNVTEFGDEACATRSTFGSIINYISERYNNGSLQCMSFEQFYHVCID